MYSVQCTVYRIQCTVYSSQCTVYSERSRLIYRGGDGCWRQDLPGADTVSHYLEDMEVLADVMEAQGHWRRPQVLQMYGDDSRV